MGENNRIFKSVKKHMTNQRKSTLRKHAGLDSQAKRKAHQRLGERSIS